MGAATLNDERIADLLGTPKRVLGDPKVKSKQKGDHLEQDWKLEGQDGSRFILYARQSTKLPEGFSCGLIWEAKDGSGVPLVRYNGPYHRHPNALDGTVIESGVCHVHKATARYIQAGHKPDGFAEATQAYRTIQEAFACILVDCRIEGATLDPTMLQTMQQLGLPWQT